MCLVVSSQLNYNIPVRSYSILKNKKASKIKAYGVSQTPNKDIKPWRKKMQGEGIVIAGVIVISILLLFVSIRKNSSLIINFVLRGILGTIAIYLTNEALMWQEIGCFVGINPLTVLTSASLGFPGVLLLYGIKLYSIL